ncbi:MAG: DUF1343 domain-containing protein [Verrucomicrobiota bacterium]|nr:DUF1343 domain-containing protein [Verrucomicrobiota bacterium]
MRFDLYSSSTHNKVSLGIDELERMAFSPLKGKRVGLITNQTGVNSKGNKTRSVLFNAKNVNLVSLYTPEHGLDGDELAGKWVSSRIDSLTGLKAFSLYGKTRKPDANMLKGIDTLVFDIQDVGVRCYTYISTMGLCMEAAAENDVEFIVLDRPNPVDGINIEGPPITKDWYSFVGMFPVAFRHGLTVGEIAKMASAEGWLSRKPKLRIIKMKGWKRSMSWDDTGLNWVQTSPNIPRADSCFYYLLSCIPQHVTGVYAGTGTNKPFQNISTNGISSSSLVDALNLDEIKGVKYKPYSYAKHPRRGGVNLEINEDYNGPLVASGLTILKHILEQADEKKIELIPSKKGANSLLYKVYGTEDIGKKSFRDLSINNITKSWKPFLKKYNDLRSKHLLYR